MNQQIDDAEIKRIFNMLQNEYDRQHEKVKEFFETCEQHRKSIWDSIIQFNSILIGVFSVMISINENINKIYFMIFYPAAFLSIILISINLFTIKRQAESNRRIALDALLKMSPTERIEDLIKKGIKPDYVRINYKAIPRSVGVLGNISLFMTVLTFAYFVILIYCSV
jgi:hypothetical protein